MAPSTSSGADEPPRAQTPDDKRVAHTPPQHASAPLATPAPAINLDITPDGSLHLSIPLSATTDPNQLAQLIHALQSTRTTSRVADPNEHARSHGAPDTDATKQASTVSNAATDPMSANSFVEMTSHIQSALQVRTDTEYSDDRTMSYFQTEELEQDHALTHKQTTDPSAVHYDSGREVRPQNQSHPSDRSHHNYSERSLQLSENNYDPRATSPSHNQVNLPTEEPSAAAIASRAVATGRAIAAAQDAVLAQGSPGRSPVRRNRSLRSPSTSPSSALRSMPAENDTETKEHARTDHSEAGVVFRDSAWVHNGKNVLESPKARSRNKTETEWSTTPEIARTNQQNLTNLVEHDEENREIPIAEDQPALHSPQPPPPPPPPPPLPQRPSASRPAMRTPKPPPTPSVLSIEALERRIQTQVQEDAADPASVVVVRTPVQSSTRVVDHPLPTKSLAAQGRQMSTPIITTTTTTTVSASHAMHRDRIRQTEKYDPEVADGVLRDNARSTPTTVLAVQAQPHEHEDILEDNIVSTPEQRPPRFPYNTGDDVHKNADHSQIDDEDNMDTGGDEEGDDVDDDDEYISRPSTAPRHPSKRILSSVGTNFRTVIPDQVAVQASSGYATRGAVGMSQRSISSPDFAAGSGARMPGVHTRDALRQGASMHTRGTWWRRRKVFTMHDVVDEHDLGTSAETDPIALRTVSAMPTSSRVNNTKGAHIAGSARAGKTVILSNDQPRDVDEIMDDAPPERENPELESAWRDVEHVLQREFQGRARANAGKRRMFRGSAGAGLASGPAAADQVPETSHATAAAPVGAPGARPGVGDAAAEVRPAPSTTRRFLSTLGSAFVGKRRNSVMVVARKTTPAAGTPEGGSGASPSAGSPISRSKPAGGTAAADEPPSPEGVVHSLVGPGAGADLDIAPGEVEPMGRLDGGSNSPQLRAGKHMSVDTYLANQRMAERAGAAPTDGKNDELSGFGSAAGSSGHATTKNASAIVTYPSTWSAEDQGSAPNSRHTDKTPSRTGLVIGKDPAPTPVTSTSRVNGQWLEFVVKLPMPLVISELAQMARGLGYKVMRRASENKLRCTGQPESAGPPMYVSVYFVSIGDSNGTRVRVRRAKADKNQTEWWRFLSFQREAMAHFDVLVMGTHADGRGT